MSREVDDEVSSDASSESSESEREEENEYERERRARIAENMAHLEAVQKAADDLNSDIRSCSKKRKPKPKVNFPAKKRRSSRVQTIAQKEKTLGDNLYQPRECSGNREEQNEQVLRHSERGSEASRDRTSNSNDGSGNRKRLKETDVEPETAKGHRIRRRNAQCNANRPVSHMEEDHNPKQNPISTASQFQPPGEFAWVPFPLGQQIPGMYGMMPGFQHGMIPGNWMCQKPPQDSGANMVENLNTDSTKDNEGGPSKSSSLKEDSVKRRMRRSRKKEVEEESMRREDAGLKPYTVQVRSTGLIDAGCKGHLEWQQFVRDMTPRMLDMSVVKYEDQLESSRNMLRESLFAKFEFLDHKVTERSFDTMIRTWLRRDRERMKRVFGGKNKVPDKYSQPQWDSMKVYWDSPSYKQKSEKMIETRRKVGYNPRVGRHGYAGKDAELKSIRSNSPGVADRAEDLEASQDNPPSSNMEKQQVWRLSSMERNQAETNRRLDENNKRLDDVMKSNVQLQQMLMSVLSNFAGKDTRKEVISEICLRQKCGETSGKGTQNMSNVNVCSGGKDHDEAWWDKLCHKAPDEDVSNGGGNQRLSASVRLDSQKRTPKLRVLERCHGEFTAEDKDETTMLEMMDSVNETKVRHSSQKEKITRNVEERKLRVGDRVWLGDTEDKSRKVATGIVTGLGGHGVFHTRPIPEDFVRINVEEIFEDIPLMFPVEDADQMNLEDARGSSVLWYVGLTSIREEVNY